MASQFTIIQIRKFPSGEISRTGKMDTVVFYVVDGTRPGRITLANDNPSEKEIIDAIQKAEKGIHPALGKTFPL